MQAHTDTLKKHQKIQIINGTFSFASWFLKQIKNREAKHVQKAAVYL